MLNKRLCDESSAACGRTSEGYEKAKNLWEQRLPIMPVNEVLELARNCHKIAPFLNYNGNTFVATVGYLINRQIKMPAVKLAVLRSLSGHFIAGTITVAEKGMLSLLLNHEKEALKIGDLVQTLKGSVKGVVTELLPDGNVMYKTTLGITLKSSVDALIKQI